MRHRMFESCQTPLDVMVQLAAADHSSPDLSQRWVGLPFVPRRFDAGLNCWRFDCVNLQDDGRCGDYEHRPYGPCVLFEPASDPLCVLIPHEVKPAD